MNHPVAESRRIWRKDRGRRIEGIGAGQVVIKQVWIGIKKEEVSIAVIERVVALVIDLLFGAMPGIDLCRIAERLNRGRRSVGLSLIGEREASSGRRVTIPCILDI